ncbi:hypothetical protein [Anaerolentibacter hominis]
MNAVIKKWLANGCQETAEEIGEVIKAEYRGKAAGGQKA